MRTNEVIFRTDNHYVHYDGLWYGVYREEFLHSVMRGFYSDKNKAIRQALDQEDLLKNDKR